MTGDRDTSITFTIKKTGPVRAALITAVIIFLLGFADLKVGSRISFSIFYLIPVTLAVFLSGRTLGLAASAVCAIVWIVADLYADLRYDSVLIPIWNTFVRLGYFIFHTLLLSKLLRTIEEVKDVSFHDPLTKAANWRFFEEYANKVIKTSVREKRKIGIAYMDVDNFKAVNDTLGHGIGDEVLVTVSAIMRREVRPSDLVARLGGDEFALIVQDIEAEALRDLLARINDKVRLEMEARRWNVTLSVGAAVFAVLPSTVGPMLKTVDDLMYEVKKSGKNDIRVEER